MKQDQNKHLRNLARKIAKLENDICLGKDVKSAQDKIENIMNSLSFGEVIYIDNYINKKNLTK